MQLGRQRAQVADPEPAVAQGGRWTGAPLVEHQLHPPYGLERRTCRRPVDDVLGPLGGGQRGQLVGGVRRGVAAAQGQADLARQHHAAAAARHQQPVGQQLFRGGGGVLGQHGVPGGAGRRRAAGVEDVLEHRPGGGRQCGEAPFDLGGRQGVDRDRPQAADARGARRQRLGHRRQRAHALRALPGEGQVQQPVERRAHRRRVAVDHVHQLVGAGLADDDEGIKDTELEPVQLVERAQDRGPGGRTRGELAGVMRGWSGEIGAFVEQTGQPFDRPVAELVGERAVRRRGHPSHATGPDTGGPR